MLVVIHHATLMWFGWHLHGGWAPGIRRPWLVQFFMLPIIRLLISGPPQVAIFFVVSGYAISHKPLKLMRQGRFSEASATLCSSIFRRHSRLFIPAAIVSFCCAVATQMNESWFPGYAEGQPGAVFPALPPPHFPTFGGQMMHWANSQAIFTSPLLSGIATAKNANVPDNEYNHPMWTLPVEFAGSMFVFAFLVAFTRIHSRVRLGFALFVGCYLYWLLTCWSIFLFMGGMFICDLHFEIEEFLSRRSQNSSGDVLPLWARSQQDRFSKITSWLTRPRGAAFLLRRACAIAAFIFALMVLSVPAFNAGAKFSTGYVTIASWAPARFKDQFLVPVGAILTILVLDLAPFLQVLFTNRFSQYLGRISFSLYLIHGPLMWSLGLRLTNYFVSVTGGVTGGGFLVSILLTSAVWCPIAVYIADLTTTFVDQPVLRFTRWAYEKLSRKEEVPMSTGKAE